MMKRARRSRAPALEVLAWVWTSVNTALGLIYGAIGAVSAWMNDLTYSVSYRDGAVQFRGSELPLARANAIVFGNTIHYHRNVDPNGNTRESCVLREHEAHHVFQYRRLGPFFLPVYITVSVVMLFQREHPLEASAEAHAQAACP